MHAYRGIKTDRKKGREGENERMKINMISYNGKKSSFS